MSRMSGYACVYIIFLCAVLEQSEPETAQGAGTEERSVPTKSDWQEHDSAGSVYNPGSIPPRLTSQVLYQETADTVAARDGRQQTPCAPTPPNFVVFAWGCFGNALVFTYLLQRNLRAPDGPPKYYKMASFWITSIAMMALSGGVALGLHADTPFLAMHVGAATPLIIRTLAPHDF